MTRIAPVDRLRVLELVATGSVDVDEAIRLLNALRAAHEPPPISWRPGRPWRITVRVWEDGRRVLNVWLPLFMLPWGLRLARRFAPSEELKELDVGELRHAIAHGGRGPVIQIDDGKDRIHIELA